MVELRTKHDRARHDASYGTYRSWVDMLAACSMPSSARFATHGALGIKVCSRWQSIDNFIADMGEKLKGYALFRRDVTKDFEPDNCYWDVRSKIKRSTPSHTRLLTYEGKTQNLTQWATQHGMAPSQLYNRLATGKTMEQALQPPKTRRKRKIEPAE
jgi:hypothetical protein